MATALINQEITDQENTFNVRLKQYQYDFIFSPDRYPAMISGWATGKSMCGILRALIYTEQIPNNLGVIFRKEFVDLRDSTIQDFERYTGRQVNSNRNVEFDNKSKIMFRHIEEINNIQNVNLGWFMIEQVEELESDKEFFMLHGRLRRDLKPNEYFKELGLAERTGFVIGNVGQAWVRRLWREEPAKGYSLVSATTFDNADVLPEDYLQDLRNLEKLKPEIYRRYVLNDWETEDDSFILIHEQDIHALKDIYFYETIIGNIIACDPSAGGDECVIYVIRNNRIVDKRYMYERDTMKVVGHIMLLSEKHEIRDIAVDNIGIGQPIGDRLAELNRHVIRINSANTSNNPKQFYNIRTEMWWYVMERIMNKELPYPEDEELRRQLSSVKYKVVNSNGQIKLEAKDEVKKRIDRSPDRADAFVYGIWAMQFTNKRNELIRPYKYKVSVIGV